MLKRLGPVEHSTLTIQHSSEAGPDGAVAQLGEHLLCKQGVVGSIPISSTNNSQVEPKYGWCRAGWGELPPQQNESEASRETSGERESHKVTRVQRWSSRPQSSLTIEYGL